ncbi:MAG: cell division protein FtsQ/DivIB [Acidimicrobiia bacterium]
MRIDRHAPEVTGNVGVRDARGRLRRLAWLAIALGTLGIVAWLLHSPWLSVRHIEVSGAGRSDVMAGLDAAGLREGSPMIWIRPGRVESSLQRDPWIHQAAVSVVFPQTVEVAIDEHTPVVSVDGPRGWMLLAADGTVLEVEAGPDPGLPAAWVGADSWPRGAVVDDPKLLAVAEFAAQLSPGLATGMTLTSDGEELWAEVPWHRIRLGRPVDMVGKGRALQSILDHGLVEGATINLIAPRRPAVSEPLPLSDP